MTKGSLGASLLSLVTLLLPPAIAQPPAEALDRVPAPVIAAGDVTANSAVLWVQTDRAGTVLVELAAPEGGEGVPRRFERRVGADSDFTAKIPVHGLAPGSVQRWRATVINTPEPGDPEIEASESEVGPPATATPGMSSTQAPDETASQQALGSFRTAPDRYAAAPVKLTWGGDLGGQNVCRDAERGFEIFDAIGDVAPDLFIGAGDMIYADDACEVVGRYGNAQIPASFVKAADLDGFRAHWRYSRADPALRRLLAQTAYYAVWDDHEVVNDFGPLHDTRDDPPYRPGEHLMPLGLKAMFEQNPIIEDPLTPKRLYRSFRWGQHLELLLLDTRQYRDANLATDSPERPKTLLGREQLTWLKQRLALSDATWVIVVSSVPMSIPTGWPPEAGRDGWADVDGQRGFEQELRSILVQAAAHGRGELVFISADVHFGAAFQYLPFADLPGFAVHELVAGPLSAGIDSGDTFDRDLGAERLFLHAPESREAVTDYDEARRWFSFGELGIDAAGELTAMLRGVDGAPLYTLRLTPATSTRLAASGPMSCAAGPLGPN
ncbi:MAG: alkaline phosphatase D family protein [Thiohalocapsa sp.]